MELNKNTITKHKTVTFEFKRSEITPVYAFLIQLGNFRTQLIQLYSGVNVIDFEEADFIKFRTAYIQSGKMKDLKERLTDTI